MYSTVILCVVQYSFIMCGLLEFLDVWSKYSSVLSGLVQFLCCKIFYSHAFLWYSAISVLGDIVQLCAMKSTIVMLWKGYYSFVPFLCYVI